MSITGEPSWGSCVKGSGNVMETVGSLENVRAILESEGDSMEK